MSVAPERALCSTCGRAFTSGERFCPFDRTDLRPTPVSAVDPLVGTVLGGSYTLLSKLGGGGMGVVYRARQNRLQRDVALKILSPQLSADDHARERFRIEALAVSQLSNPHTVAIHDFGSTEDDLLYLVMQLLDGESLRSRLSRGPLSLRAACAIAAQVFESLSEAHDRRPQIVHRDVKPDNIVVKRLPDGDEFATVLDFGLAKLADGDKLTATGLIVGTPAYMAPEQTRADGDLDYRVDLYAVGAVLHEMISGRPPFTAPNPTALLYKHVWEPPPSLSSVCPGQRIPGDLDRLVLELLAKNPGERPLSAAFARSRLLEVLKQLPPESPPALTEPPSLVPTVQSPALSAANDPSPRPSAAVPFPRPTQPIDPFAPDVGPQPTIGAYDEPPSLPAPLPARAPSEVPIDLSDSLPPMSSQPKRGSRTGLWIGLGVAVVILAAAAWLVLGRGTSPEPPPLAPAKVAAPTPPPAPSPVVAPPAPPPVVAATTPPAAIPSPVVPPAPSGQTAPSGEAVPPSKSETPKTGHSKKKAKSESAPDDFPVVE